MRLDDVMMSVDQSECANRIINQSDCNCARFWEASKIRHQVLGSERWVYWMTLYFWLIKMAPQQLPWLVRMCVINHKNVVPKIKTLNTHNSVNFYSNWKIDPSKPNFSAPSLPMLVQAEELTGGKEMTFFDSPLNGVVTFFDPRLNGVATFFDPPLNGVVTFFDPQLNGVTTFFLHLTGLWLFLTLGLTGSRLFSTLHLTGSWLFLTLSLTGSQLFFDLQKTVLSQCCTALSMGGYELSNF